MISFQTFYMEIRPVSSPITPILTYATPAMPRRRGSPAALDLTTDAGFGKSQVSQVASELSMPQLNLLINLLTQSPCF